MVLQQADEILYMRGLSSAAHRDVSHRNDRRTERAALQDSHLEQLISDTDAQAIEPAKGQQLLIDCYKIAFQN